MVSLDEPAHARLRKPAARAFSMKRVTAMIPTIEATTTRLLDTVNTTTEFDLIATLAFPLSATIVFSLMGVPERDHGQLKQWCGYRAALGWGRPTPQDQVEIATKMPTTCRSSSSTVQYRCPDGKLTGNTRMGSHFRVDSHKRLPATSTTPPEKRRTTRPII
jgi:hypothetical protein